MLDRCLQTCVGEIAVAVLVAVVVSSTGVDSLLLRDPLFDRIVVGGLDHHAAWPMTPRCEKNDTLTLAMMMDVVVDAAAAAFFHCCQLVLNHELSKKTIPLAVVGGVDDGDDVQIEHLAVMRRMRNWVMMMRSHRAFGGCCCVGVAGVMTVLCIGLGKARTLSQRGCNRVQTCCCCCCCLWIRRVILA